jgi:hypothetical protein
VVDSLARTARKYSNKRALAADSSTGNAATFLAKLENFLESIFRDIVHPSVPEGKVSFCPATDLAGIVVVDVRRVHVVSDFLGAACCPYDLDALFQLQHSKFVTHVVVLCYNATQHVDTTNVHSQRENNIEYRCVVSFSYVIHYEEYFPNLSACHISGKSKEDT